MALLLEHGADPNVSDVKGSTPLMMAASCEDTRAVDLLLRAGANPNATTPADGFTALWMCTAKGHDGECPRAAIGQMTSTRSLQQLDKQLGRLDAGEITMLLEAAQRKSLSLLEGHGRVV